MKLAYRIQGSGEPLVLIHGMGSASTTWRLLEKELSAKFQLITFDLPGHGKSEWQSHMAMDPHSLAEIIKENLDSLGIKEAHLAGNSLGGWIALEIAASWPESVKSVTALAPAGLWLVPTTHRTLLGATSRFMAATTYKFADQLMKHEWARKLGFAEVSPRWQELPHEVLVDAVIAYGSSPGYFPAWDGMLKRRFDKEISQSIPVTILFGDTDNTLPAQTSQEKSLAPSHARWVVLPQSGHAPMWDRSQECIAEIIATASLAKR
jgi:pimeloyl-ACP methyl ester carboxylesterase